MDTYRVEFMDYRLGRRGYRDVKAESRGKAITAAIKRSRELDRAAILSAYRV